MYLAILHTDFRKINRKVTAHCSVQGDKLIQNSLLLQLARAPSATAQNTKNKQTNKSPIHSLFLPWGSVRCSCKTYSYRNWLRCLGANHTCCNIPKMFSFKLMQAGTNQCTNNTIFSFNWTDFYWTGKMYKVMINLSAEFLKAARRDKNVIYQNSF